MPWNKEEELNWYDKWRKADVDENRALQEELMGEWFDQSRKSPKLRRQSQKTPKTPKSPKSSTGNLGDKKLVTRANGTKSVRYLNKRKDGTMYWGIINPLKVKTKKKPRKYKSKKSKKKSKKRKTRKSKKKSKKTKSKRRSVKN